jgi:diaminohydroxyphosphoribosylaminopyrimidine deaminase/5-amino-6-(5-phosphoribosylamino)uracil reductase
MLLALKLAQNGRYSVSPNPMVGCVLINDGCIVGTGWHKQAGHAHAEINALTDAGARAFGTTAYVNLEPCCHTGKTPPCTDALIKAGIKKVVIAMLDPNPLVCGKGIQALQQAGIEVEVGVEKQRAIELNQIFCHYIKTKRSFVFLKWAMSLDGKTITHAADSRKITHGITNQLTHDIRHSVDAILIGANTAISDNPQLTVRLINADMVKQPYRIVISRYGKIPLNLKLFSTKLKSKTMIATTQFADKEWVAECEAKGIKLLFIPTLKNRMINLKKLLVALADLQITSILVEGGMLTHYEFIQQNVVNKIQVFVAPTIIGNYQRKIKLPKLAMLDHGMDHSFTTILR